MFIQVRPNKAMKTNTETQLSLCSLVSAIVSPYLDCTLELFASY